MEELLAHYTTAAAAFVNIIPTGKIRLSPLASMRDPHESTEWTMYWRGIGRNAPDEEMRTGLWRAELAVQRRVKILSMTRDIPDEAGDDLRPRCWSHPRLWDQYADRYEGVCLLFDKARLGEAITEHARDAIWRAEGEVTYGPLYHLIEANPTAFFQLVSITGEPNPEVAIPELFDRELSDRGLNPAGAPLRGHVGRVSDWLLFRKMMDWQTEQEYRYIVVDMNDDHILVPFASSLTAVILGSRFPEGQVEGSKAISAWRNIRVCSGEWRPTGLTLTDI